MDEKVLEHFKQFSSFTYPGPYLESLKKLSNDVRDIGKIVRNQLIHRVLLESTRRGHLTPDLKYGDMSKVPWHRQCEDDIYPTVSAILTELHRRDSRGLVLDRAVENRVILTCRCTSILMASILKAKGIPCRVRSGFAPYFTAVHGNKSADHWINQYWNDGRWVTIDVDGSLEDLTFDPYNIPDGKFDFSADAWLNVRSGEKNGEHFWNAGGFRGLMPIVWELFYDFHCLMNSELIYLHVPKYIRESFDKLGESELKEIDELAKLMQKPDDNFSELKEIWETKRKFRLMAGGLL